WAVYRPSRYYYEVIECSRRIALTSIAAFVFPNSTVQIFIAISEALSPFEKATNVRLY
ncbi:unnamed protein product, partial [Laminaria digitata]